MMHSHDYHEGHDHSHAGHDHDDGGLGHVHAPARDVPVTIALFRV
jgi:hypothetical protein